MGVLTDIIVGITSHNIYVYLIVTMHTLILYMLYVINISVKLGSGGPDSGVNGYKGCVHVRLNLILSGDLGPISDMWYILQHISKPFFYIINENTLANCLNFLRGKKCCQFPT